MTTLIQSVRETAQDHACADLLDSLNLAVHEDAKILDGASKALVRDRFRAWFQSPAVQREVDSSQGGQVLVGGFGITPRYSYCIHVDDDALYFTLRRDSRLINPDGYVNLIDGFWELPTHPEEVAVLREQYYRDGSDALFDDGYEPKEGCTAHKVGWMKVRIAHLMPYAYARLLSTHMFDRYYVRPPEIADFTDFVGEEIGRCGFEPEPLSGCWRRWARGVD